jgi:hypothetical protein
MLDPPKRHKRRHLHVLSEWPGAELVDGHYLLTQYPKPLVAILGATLDKGE